MCKIEVDETEWCQHEHQLKMYCIWKKAIDWRNACVENLQDHSQYYESSPKRYGAAHHLNGKARTFLEYLTGHPLALFACGNYGKSSGINDQFEAVIKELLA